MKKIKESNKCILSKYKKTKVRISLFYRKILLCDRWHLFGWGFYFLITKIAHTETSFTLTSGKENLLIFLHLE